MFDTPQSILHFTESAIHSSIGEDSIKCALIHEYESCSNESYILNFS